MDRYLIEGPKYKSEIPKIGLGQFYFDSCEKYSDRICQIDATTGEQETFGSVKSRSVRVAIELQKRGITSQDVVAFCSPNTINSIIPMLGTYYLGAKVANLEPTLSIRQTQHLISLVEPKIIFADDASVKLIEDSVSDLALKPEIIKFSKLNELTTPKENEELFKPVPVDIYETAVFLFTSGTSGLPKAICHTHSSFIHNAYSSYDIGWDKSMFHVSRLYWITSHIVLNAAFLSGGYRVFSQTFDAESIVKALERYKIHTMLMSSSMLAALANYEKLAEYDLSALKFLVMGGNPVNSVIFEKLIKAIPQTYVLLVFGMSEGVIFVFNPEIDEHLIRTKTNSCGKPMFGLTVKIVDVVTEKILGPNEKGEIRVKGPTLFSKYYKLDSSNAFDNDGFVKTGDVGYYDEDKCIYVVERIKEMFKFKGWHIVPSFLEGVLLEHPSVKEAVVFGVPWETDGDAPAACVVLKNGSNVTTQDLEKFVADKVPEKERLIGGITIVSHIPKTPTGKVLRREVREAILNKV